MWFNTSSDTEACKVFYDVPVEKHLFKGILVLLTISFGVVGLLLLYIFPLSLKHVAFI